LKRASFKNLSNHDPSRGRWLRSSDDISAGELIGGSLIAGEPILEDAAGFLAKQGRTTFLRGLGVRAIDQSATAGLAVTPDRPTNMGLEDFSFELIRRDKHRIRNDPRNAIAWADIARRYTVLGQFQHAERSLTVALGLAPSSRYLHRVASRFYVQVKRPDKAFHLLSAFPRTHDDPWLMAALLSIASVGDIRLRSIRSARRIADDTNFRPIERSELTSEIATFDLRAGADRPARKLFQQSLGQPTDNSLAQVEWASQQLPRLAVPLGDIDVPFASEAHALSAAEDGRWGDALVETDRWLEDQPFDTRAAVLATYVASVGLERWGYSIEVARLGLRSRPGHLTLINNLAYALIEDGQLEVAKPLLASVDLSTVRVGDRIALTATTGLLQFRQRNGVHGEELYQKAIDLAHRHSDRRQEAMARAMLLREKLRLYRSAENVEPLILSLRELTSIVKDKGVLLCIRRAEQMLPQNFEGLN
jgi:tetratricopeptide (TPR) repeat protein